MGDNNKKQSYFELLEERRTKGRVTTEHQLIGLTIAELLRDEGHKSLYIKLAKENDSDLLLGIAKDIAEREGIENPGAYFMKVFQGTAKNIKSKKKK